MLSVVCRKPNLFASFGWSAGDDREPFSEHDRLFLKVLIPHVQRVLSIGQSIVDHRSAIRRRDAALDSLGHGLILLDRHGKLLLANRRAEDFLAESGLLGSRHGRLAATDGEHRDTLRALVDRCLGLGCPRPQGGGFRIKLPDGRTIAIKGVPMPIDERIVLDYGERPAVVLTISSSREAPEIVDFLRTAFGLTPAEAQLVVALTNGKTTTEYAEANAIKPDTVRKHLKTIFQKTDTKGQTDLVALASRLLFS
jgi:PAS domain S-box-containing protein